MTKAELKGKIGYSDVNILKAILERLGNPSKSQNAVRVSYSIRCDFWSTTPLISPCSFRSYLAVPMYIPMQTDHSPVLICPLVEDCCPLWPAGEVPTCRTSTVLGRNQLAWIQLNSRRYKNRLIYKN